MEETNMKKLIAVLAAAVMLLSVACAETASGKESIPFDQNLSFEMAFPEGYTYTAFVDQGVLMIQVSPEELKDDSLVFLIAVGYDSDPETASAERMNDLTAEQKDALAQSMLEDISGATTEIRATGLGSELILIVDPDAEIGNAELVSIYHGCLLDMYIARMDGSAVTEDDIAVGIQIFTDMDFIEVN